MDGDEHTACRKLGLPQFKPASPAQREELSPEAIAAVLMDFFTDFAGVTTDRREHPTDDLAGGFRALVEHPTSCISCSDDPS